MCKDCCFQILQADRCQLGNLKLAILGVFTLWKLIFFNAVCFSFPVEELVGIYLPAYHWYKDLCTCDLWTFLYLCYSSRHKLIHVLRKEIMKVTVISKKICISSSNPNPVKRGQHNQVGSCKRSNRAKALVKNHWFNLCFNHLDQRSWSFVFTEVRWFIETSLCIYSHRNILHFHTYIFLNFFLKITYLFLIYLKLYD